MHVSRPYPFLLGILALSFLWITQVQAKQSFKVSIVPLLAPTVISRNWTPLILQLEKLTGHRFELRVYDQFSQFEGEFKSGLPDFIFLNPYHAVIAKQAQGYIPLVRDNSQLLSALLVVLTESKINQIQDLEGKTIAFASPNAFASLYLRALLAEKEKINIHPVYVGNPQNAYRHVLAGDAEAGGGILPILQKEPEAVQTRLKVIYTTPEVAPHPVVAHPRLPENIRSQVQQALLDMAKDPGGKKLLEAVMINQPIAADYVRDYAPLEKLHFDRYTTHSPK